MNELTVKCPKCNQPKRFKNKNSYWANKNKRSVCKDCRHKEHSCKMTGRKRAPFTNEWKRNIGIGHKKSEVWVNAMHTDEYREKQRQKMIRLIKENRTKVGFNPKACIIFDFINRRLGWGGQHAKKDREKSAAGFFLDFYDPTINVAIEWDEKHHRKPSRHRADWIKQKTVIEMLECEFYRIDDVTKTVKKVDKNSTDRTNDIQKALNEYYEKERL